MLVYIIFITLLYCTFNNVDGMFNDVHYTLFGNLTSMPDLFLNETAQEFENTTGDDNEAFDALDMEYPNVFHFPRANLSAEAFDIQDYNLVNEKFENTTKAARNQSRRMSYYDYDDIYHGEYIEGFKKFRLTNVLIQFVMHSRYEVGKALTQRDEIRNDKRYKLGYLFNRLRRLKTEQLKMVGIAWYQNQTDYRNLYSMMRLYERVVHFDIDIRDTCDLIKRIFSVDAPYDVFKVTKKSKKEKGDLFLNF